MSDGKSLGGKGRLTSARIDALQVFYGKVLRDAKTTPEEKSKLVRAVFTHYAAGSTHSDCPSGADSWCKFQKDKCLKTSTFKPIKNPLTPAILEARTSL